MSHFPLDQNPDLDRYFDELGYWLELEGQAEQERMARRRKIRSQTDVEKTGETIIGLQFKIIKPVWLAVCCSISANREIKASQ